jgi:hypothetical protein
MLRPLSPRRVSDIVAAFLSRTGAGGGPSRGGAHGRRGRAAPLALAGGGTAGAAAPAAAPTSGGGGAPPPRVDEAELLEDEAAGARARLGATGFNWPA